MRLQKVIVVRLQIKVAAGSGGARPVHPAQLPQTAQSAILIALTPDWWITGTLNLLRFCILRRLKTLSFASSIITCAGTTLATREVLDAVNEDPNSCYRMGYGQSKYIGKLLL
jgi:nucleoside-diphosphate-sugar epimerase